MEMKQNENKLKQENMEWKYEMEFLLYGMYHQFERWECTRDNQ